MIDRTRYIGSSDAKDILDGNWHQLWLKKTGRAEPEDLSDKFNVQLGVHTEDFHLDWTIRRMIEAGEISHELAGLRQAAPSPDGADFIVSHVDAMVCLDGEHHAPVEAKHSSGKRRIDELLEWYMPQMQHHLWCTEAAKGVVSVIQGNLEPERVWIGRSQEWIEVYRAACTRFWAHVTTDTPPSKNSPGVAIAPAMRDAIPVNGMVRRCADTDNMFIDRARTMIDCEANWRSYDAAKKDLKAMMGKEDGELYSAILTLKRSRSGAIRFTFHEKKDRVAA